MTDPATGGQIAAIRAFNRFYTRVIGLLDDGILHSPFSLAEARLVHEIGKLDRPNSRALARVLNMDPGQLSRLSAKLVERGLISIAPDPGDGRANNLTLTPAGTATCAELNVLSDTAVSELLAPLTAVQRASLVSCMQTISDVIGDQKAGSPELVLRSHHVGELGWLICRQAELYHREQGWNGEFEALIARIYADYELAAGMPPKQLWIAEQNGAVAGSIFVLPTANDVTTAQLRMLYVEPWARGAGIGRQLVGEAVGFSKNAGYQRIRLWTQDCLTAARRVYLAHGFRLVSEEPHRSFGADLNGQYWERDLSAQS